MSQSRKTKDLETYLRELQGKLDRGEIKREKLPAGYYNREGDCYFLFFEEAGHYGEYINQAITVCRALSDKRIVGVVISGISKLSKDKFAR